MHPGQINGIPKLQHAKQVVVGPAVRAAEGARLGIAVFDGCTVGFCAIER